MTLHFYFARRFLWTFLGIFGVFFLFQVLLDLVEQIRRFDSSVSFGEVMRLTLLNTPDGMYQILPLVMILSSIALFVSLARSSELVVTRAAGRSGLTALVGPLVVAAIIGTLAVAMGNPIVAATSKAYSDLRETYRSGGTSALSIGAEGLWLRQSDPRGQTVIRAARANPNGTVLYDVMFVAYAEGGGPVRRIEADYLTSAKFDDELVVADNQGGVIKAIPQSEAEYDYELLGQVMQELKRRMPDKRNIIILPSSDTTYQTLVSVMDSVRSYEAVVAGDVVNGELFTEISLGDAPERVEVEESS